MKSGNDDEVFGAGHISTTVVMQNSFEGLSEKISQKFNINDQPPN